MIKQETLDFLTKVAQNNNREWFALHKDEYETARENVLDLVKDLIPQLAKIDPLISGDTDPKKAIMRIYRDVRFSKNKDPYKTNFGMWFSAKSKGGNEPGYYLHLQPGNSFVAGGYWMPEAPHLKLIRQEIDYNIGDFLEIIEDKTFAADFKLSTSNALKNAPKGYDPADPNIQYLKLKSFEVLKKLTDKEVCSANLAARLAGYYKTIHPLVTFLRNAIDQ
ncbi:DUF2461 domain-containing protein [Pedobacter sp. MC2016-14]|uniref:DUF2461 domain-containing protein n=1 Tax=Pedobacter sp. MC2016-14 TaxID=2897327 RepID=UPI001E326F2D|nr:DUF2461 domain-containing protein [Pedobacter sp. MC2016-14]MCD0487707.1 DUF2461 domain-containing protein [Pedobacter sp. MC2016-14]